MKVLTSKEFIEIANKYNEVAGELFSANGSVHFLPDDIDELPQWSLNELEIRYMTTDQVKYFIRKYNKECSRIKK